MNSHTVTYPTLPDTPVSHLPFSPVVVVGGLIFVSGQASVDAGGAIVSGSFEEEFHRSMENVRRERQKFEAMVQAELRARQVLRLKPIVLAVRQALATLRRTA